MSGMLCGMKKKKVRSQAKKSGSSALRSAFVV